MALSGIKLIAFSLFFPAFIFSFTGLHAQDSVKPTINIDISATEILPADLLIFNVQINSEENSPQSAFETHRKREAVLAELLKEFDIDEDNIKYEPIRISKRYRGDDERMTTVTSQSVFITFEDFDIYEKIQISLIENGFDSFNGQFSSSKIEDGKEKALKKAIEAARKKAELIAETSGVDLGRVQKINFSDHNIGFGGRAHAMEMPPPSMEDSMMDFPQTVTVTANISISFAIE